MNHAPFIRYALERPTCLPRVEGPAGRSAIESKSQPERFDVRRVGAGEEAVQADVEHPAERRKVRDLDAPAAYLKVRDDVARPAELVGELLLGPAVAGSFGADVRGDDVAKVVRRIRHGSARYGDPPRRSYRRPHDVGLLHAV